MKKEVKNINDQLKENLVTKLSYPESEITESQDGSSQFRSGDISSDFFENLFKIENESFNEAFEIVTKGIGDESSKISSLISSSLLSLLCFHELYNNLNDKSLVINFKDYGADEIGEICFEDCMFEVRNKVVSYQYPSCPDLLLISHSSKILFFLESKFTEPITSQSKKSYGKSYLPLYSSLKERLHEIDIFLEEDEDTGETILFTNKENKYIDGIKQSISHMIGISRGPSENDKGYYPKKYSEKFKELFNNPEYKKIYGTILYDHGKLIETYTSDFQKFFKNEYAPQLLSYINGWNGEAFEDLENLRIISTPLTYQKLFNYKGNKGLLTENIINFYDL